MQTQVGADANNYDAELKMVPTLKAGLQAIKNLPQMRAQQEDGDELESQQVAAHLAQVSASSKTHSHAHGDGDDITDTMIAEGKKDPEGEYGHQDDDNQSSPGKEMNGTADADKAE